MAAHRNSGRTDWSRSPNSRSGTQAAAWTPPFIGAGKILRPSCTARFGPQTKQVGNGCCGAPFEENASAGDAAIASVASGTVIGAGGVTAIVVGFASTTTFPPWRRTPPVCVRSSCNGTSKGIGARRVHSTKPPNSPASRSQVYPPLPDSGGPQKRAATVNESMCSVSHCRNLCDAASSSGPCTSGLSQSRHAECVHYPRAGHCLSPLAPCGYNSDP